MSQPVESVLWTGNNYLTEVRPFLPHSHVALENGDIRIDSQTATGHPITVRRGDRIYRDATPCPADRAYRTEESA